MSPRILCAAGAKAAGMVLASLLAVGLIVGGVAAAPAAPKEKLVVSSIPDLGLAGRTQAVKYVPGEVLVRYEAGPAVGAAPLSAASFQQVRAQAEARVQQLAGQVGAQVVGGSSFPASARFPQGLHLFRLRLPEGMDVQAAIAAFERMPGVAYAEPNYIYQPDVTYAERVAGSPRVAPDATTPTDSLFGLQWALNNTGQEFRTGFWGTPDADIDAVEAWDFEKGDGQVVVAVIDTGIDPAHPDLAGNMWQNPDEIPDNGVDDDGNGFIDDVYGWDFYWNDNTVYDPADAEYHGTHVAGTIGAVSDNGSGVAGVAWNVKIMALKFLGPQGGYTSGAIDALAYATAMKEKYELRMLTSNSWGGGGYSQALKDAIEASGMLFVAAAGNDALDNEITPHYPSSYDSENIIAVASTDWEDQLSSFSNWGATSVDLAAPGDYILSTIPIDFGGNYAYASGTSMATPHVSGVAALVMSEYPDEDWAAVKARILDGVDQRPALRGRVLTGGRLNALTAVTGRKPPRIDSASISATYAAPGTPLTFTGAASDPDGTIQDQYWDFGDGTEPVQGAAADHAYDTAGGYFATFHAVDDQGNEAIMGFWVVAANPGEAGTPATSILVDDDGNTSNDDTTEYYFEPALQAADIEYARVESILDLPTDIPSPVIWNTGVQYSGTLTGPEQAWLAAFLEQGGSLYLSGEDLLYELTGGVDGPVSGFAREYLHVAAVLQDVGATSLTGVPGDPIGDGVSVPLDFKDDYSDGLIPDGAARAVFLDENGRVNTLRYYTGNERVVFGAFLFEAVPYDATAAPDPNNRVALLKRIHQFLTDPSANASPTVQSVTASPQFGLAAPTLTVNFTATATDPEGAVSYEWNFGDGGTATGQSVSHAYTPGVYTATLTVTDNAGEQATATISVVAVAEAASVVFVDDDDSDPDSEGYFTQALDAAGIPYVVVSPAQVAAWDGSVADGLSSFPVVWNVGEVGYTNDAEQEVLRGFLDDGGGLFLSGQDELFNIPVGPGTFATDYLRVTDVEHDVGTQGVSGISGDPITDGMEIGLDFPFNDWSDVISVDSSADVIFVDAQDSTQAKALKYVGPNRERVVFFAFPFEAVPYDDSGATDPNNSVVLIQRIVRFLTAPVALAGPDRQVEIGATVQLDGSASFDPQGDELTYHWEMVEVPEGSGAALSDKSTVNPTFVADRAGRYRVQLVVSDGTSNSPPDLVVITANSAPTANAGPDQQVAVGATVQLDGSASSDPDGHELSYYWSLEAPEGSSAILSDEHAVNPTFVADRMGTYRVQLVVNDGISDSAPDEVVITANTPPVADAGPDRYGAPGAPIRLDGSGSHDPDQGDTLIYAWSVTGAPAGAKTEITQSDPAQPEAVLKVDKTGEYQIRLVVTDSFGTTDEDTVRIRVVAAYAAPNPAKAETTFYYDGDLDGGQLLIYNVAGRLVRQLDLTEAGTTTWDLTDTTGRPAGSGLYLWLLVDEDGQPVLGAPQRLVVQR